MEIKGFTYGYDSRKGMLGTEESKRSIEALAALGGNWAALAFFVTQERPSSSRFGFDFRFGNTDKEIEKAVGHLKEQGLKVCLKPMINCEDGTWRAMISFPDESFSDGTFPYEKGVAHSRTGYWDEWFSCYTAFLCHYAEIAEDTGCEMLCIGCEMLGTEHRGEQWRALIGEVRKIYHGDLVYNANHGKEDRVKWFDAVDYIGTSAYYPVAGKGGASVDEMTKAWEEHKAEIRKVTDRFGKKIIFMEIGCRSANGCAAMPWDYEHRELPRDEDEQANFYESAMRAMWNEPYFAGFFWWDWNTYLMPEEKVSTDTGFGIHGKKAEKILTEWYRTK